MRNRSRGKLIALALILITIFTAAAGKIYRGYFAPLVNYSPYERIDFEYAEQRTGFRIPLPTHLPTGYVLAGIYMYPTPENVAKATDAKLPPRPPFEPFQVVFKRRTHVLVLRLYGGDTRDEESRTNTGGDIPVDFGLSGESVNVNGATGLMQSDLNRRSIFGTEIHSCLVWRLSYTSAQMTNLKALFLALESDELSSSDLLEVAESVR